MRPVVRSRLIAATLILAASLLSLSVASASDFEPVKCDAAKPYRGKPLHASVDADTFAAIGRELTGALDAATSARLDAAAAKALTLARANAMTLAVGVPGQGVLGRGLWSTTVDAKGATSGADAPLAFHWASVGKAFTGAVIAQLIAEGKLSLDAPLSRWDASLPNARVITVDHLLTHTSGLFSFNSDLKFRARRGYQPPGVLLDIAKKHGNAFCPGEAWAYTNTGYALLGRIIEAIDGRPLHEALTARIITPLGLRRTRALPPAASWDGLARPFTSGKDPEVLDPSTPFGAGIITSTADDLIRFWHALLTGRVVPSAAVPGLFERLYPMFDEGTFYGRGVMLYTLPPQDGVRETWLGHSGGSAGVKAVVAYSVERRAFVAVALTGDGPAEAMANLLLRTLSAPRP